MLYAMYHLCQAINFQKLYTLLISCGTILNIKFMTSFVESNLSSCADFISLDPCLIAQHPVISHIPLGLLSNIYPYKLHKGTAQLR